MSKRAPRLSQSEAKKKTIILREYGLTYRQIGIRLGFGSATVRKWNLEKST